MCCQEKSKIPIKDCLKPPNKTWKPIFHELISKKSLFNKILKHCLDFQEKDFNFVTKKSAKKWKVLFQTIRRLVSGLNVASTLLSKMLALNNFGFKKLSRLFLAFQENGFNFVTQIYAKNWKKSFSDVQNIHVYSQGSFKTIF